MQQNSAEAREVKLIDQCVQYAADPLGFVLAMFPWREPGELVDQDGPREWQRDILRTIGDRLKAGAELQDAIQIAVASGHGIGKSALMAWVILWSISTMRHARGVVTANTDGQLRTKTWPEVSKWHRL